MSQEKVIVYQTQDGQYAYTAFNNDGELPRIIKELELANLTVIGLRTLNQALSLSKNTEGVSR